MHTIALFLLLQAPPDDLFKTISGLDTALFDAAPRVKKWIAACHARPAFKTMMAKRETEPA